MKPFHDFTGTKTYLPGGRAVTQRDKGSRDVCSVRITGSSYSGVDAFYALSGCRTPTQISDRGCLPAPEGTYHHVSVLASRTQHGLYNHSSFLLI